MSAEELEVTERGALVRVLNRSIKDVDLAMSDIRNLAPKTALGRLESVLEALETVVECVGNRDDKINER